MQRGRPQAQRIETGNVNAGLFQATTDPWPRIALASVVDQHLELHATRLGLRQRGDKMLADCVVVEADSAKPDTPTYVGDRRPNPRIGLPDTVRSVKTTVGQGRVSTCGNGW